MCVHHMIIDMHTCTHIHKNRRDVKDWLLSQNKRDQLPESRAVLLIHSSFSRTTRRVILKE